MSWWHKNVTKKVSKAVKSVLGGGSSTKSTSASSSTPAVAVSSPAVSAPINESAATESTVQSAAQAQNLRAKGKRRLTINTNNTYNPLGL